MKPKQIYAEDINFWRTNKSDPGKWIELCKKQIQYLGGHVFAEAFGADDGRSAYVIGFDIGGDKFKTVWPVVKSKCGDVGAERRQAATTLYHVVKAKCLEAVVRGPRVAFAGDWLLEDGRTVAEHTSESMLYAMPLMIMAPKE
jgi:hypothetical protein